MWRPAILHGLLLVLALATAAYVETGTRRYNQLSAEGASHALAYEIGDHTGEVVFIGSSLAGRAFIPQCLDEALAKRSVDCHSYILWLPRAVMPTYYTLVRDLVIRRGRPRLVVLCLGPRECNGNLRFTEDLCASTFPSVSDASRLLTYQPWRRRGLAWYALARPARVLPGLLSRPLWERLILADVRRAGAGYSYDPQRPGDIERLNRKRKQLPPKGKEEEEYRASLARRRAQMAGFGFGDFPEWFALTVGLAKAHGIPVAVCVMGVSDRARADLQGGMLAETSRRLELWARERGLPFWVLTNINPRLADSKAYMDVDHCLPQTAIENSRALAAGPLGEWLLAQTARR